MSLLCYRFPREQVVRQSGYFHELPSDIKDYEGFILSNFTLISGILRTARLATSSIGRAALLR